MDISKKLKKLRVTHGFTLEELASKSGVTSDMIGRIERGERRLTTDYLIRISRALGESPSALIDEDPVDTVRQEDSSQLIEKIIEKLEKVFLENNMAFNSTAKAKLALCIYQEAISVPPHQRSKFIISLMNCLSFILEYRDDKP